MVGYHTGRRVRHDGRLNVEVAAAQKTALFRVKFAQLVVEARRGVSVPLVAFARKMRVENRHVNTVYVERRVAAGGPLLCDLYLVVYRFFVFLVVSFFFFFFLLLLNLIL